MKVRVSSKIDETEVAFEFLTVLDASIIKPEFKPYSNLDQMVAFPLKSDNQIDFIKYLVEQYDLQYGIVRYDPCIAVKYSKAYVNLGRKTVELNGVFKDDGKWDLLIDYDKKRIKINANHNSLRNNSNYEKYLTDYITDL
jgi:hypothetical protein